MDLIYKNIVTIAANEFSEYAEQLRIEDECEYNYLLGIPSKETRYIPWYKIELITQKYKNDDKKRLDMIYGEENPLPDAYGFFERIIRVKFIQLVKTYLHNESNNVPVELKKMTDFFEKMAQSDDFDIRNLLGIAIFEGITSEQDEFKLIERLLGDKSKEIFYNAIH